MEQLEWYVLASVVPIVRPTPHALVPVELPSTIGDLKALESLDVQLNSLRGEHLRSTNCASDPADTVACSCARVDWRASGAHGALSQRQQPERYVPV